MSKRKTVDSLPLTQDATLPNGLEMQSEDEAEDPGSETDDEVVEPFPELNLASDTDAAQESDSDIEDEEETDAESTSSRESHHIFPKGKNVISDITGELKIVYPEIEPEYDSDSSTEDVCQVF